MVEAGFPASNPKEEEFFGLLARETFRTAQIAAFGMTRRRDLRGRRGPGAAAAGRLASRPVCTIVGKTWPLHLEKVVGRRRATRTCAMIEESVAFLARQGKRVVYDAEHFFDA